MNNNFDRMPQRINSYKWEDLKYEDTLSLDIADMDFSLSEEVLLPFIERIRKGNFGYEHEGESYYDALRSWYRRNHKLEIERSWIITSPGVISGIKTAICAFSNENDAVIVLSPMYHSYITSVRNNNRRIVYCPMDYNNGNYQVNLERFEALIYHEKIKIFIFCTPNNPTGKVFSGEEIESMLAICRKYQVLVIADEVYEDFIYENVSFHSCVEYAEQYERLIVAKSLCKTFNTAGIQVANFFIFNEGIRNIFNKEKQKRAYLANNLMGIVMTECLFAYGDKWHRECFQYILENIRIFKQFINENYPEVVITQSQSLYMLWIDFSKLCSSSVDINQIFTERMHVKVAEGERFGMHGQYKDFVRINFACPRWIILEMIKRMDKELKRLKEKKG